MTFGLGDVDAHQRRNFGGVKCTCLKTPHATTCPKSLTTVAEPTSAIDKKRGLKKLREPNATEAEYGRILEARLRRGEILGYGFEAITLRAMDMEYTPDFHVWRVSDAALVDPRLASIEHDLIEIKGGYKWEDSVVKWKAFAKGGAFPWAKFEFHQKVEGQWHRLG